MKQTYALLLSGLMLSAFSAHAGTFYLNDSSGNLFANSSAAPFNTNYTLIGNTYTAGGAQIATGGFLDIGSAGGVLYGLDSLGTLYSIDIMTAAATTIGSTGITDGSLAGLSDSASGLLIAGGNGNVYTLNTTTGAATAGTLGGAYTTDDLELDGAGNLWLASPLSQGTELYEIDPNTGAVILDSGRINVLNVYGLAYSSDTNAFWGFARNNVLFDVDTAVANRSGSDLTGQVRGDAAFDSGLTGAAFLAPSSVVASTPEPATLGLALIGSVLILFAARRRRQPNQTV